MPNYFFFGSAADADADGDVVDVAISTASYFGFQILQIDKQISKSAGKPTPPKKMACVCKRQEKRNKKNKKQNKNKNKNKISPKHWWSWNEKSG